MLYWNGVGDANTYDVQIATSPSFDAASLVATQTNTSVDTFKTTIVLEKGTVYYWRVRPFNYWDICTEFTESESFMALSASSADAGPAGGSLRCYPTRLSSGQPLAIELPGGWQGQAAQCRVFDTAGRLCWQSEQTPAGDKVFVKIPLENWPAGVYRLVWTNRSGHGTATFVWENF